jgi:uroporphyrinogen decarboxylase
MRQAGRSLPEYRALRGDGDILDAIRHPEMAAEATLQPVRRYGVDAAILFSDIMVPVAAVGFGVTVRPGVGPVTDTPFREATDLDRLRPLEPPVDMPWVAEAVRLVVAELAGRAGREVPLIAFAGGPFTLASYLIEGQPSRDHPLTKRLMYSEPELWRELLQRLANLVIASLCDQVQAGAGALQVFDSWIGALSPRDYEAYVLPASRYIFEATAHLGVPRIHFGVGTGELLGLMAAAGADVIGVDWRVPLNIAAERVSGHGVTALQGNLDPVVCLAPWGTVEREARLVLAEATADLGHVFSLGHGVLPQTDPGILARLVELVHEETARV